MKTYLNSLTAYIAVLLVSPLACAAQQNSSAVPQTAAPPAAQLTASVAVAQGTPEPVLSPTPAPPCRQPNVAATRVHFVCLEEFDQANRPVNFALGSIAVKPTDTGPQRLQADLNSTIVIHFDVDALAREDLVPSLGPYNTGRLSLGATLAGRKVEVENYSEVGTDRRPIGARNVAPAPFLANLQEFQLDLFELWLTPLEPTLGEADPFVHYVEKAQVLSALLDEFRTAETVDAFFRILGVSTVVVNREAEDLATSLRGFGQAYQEAAARDRAANEKNRLGLSSLREVLYGKRKEIDALRAKKAKAPLGAADDERLATLQREWGEKHAELFRLLSTEAWDVSARYWTKAKVCIDRLGQAIDFEFAELVERKCGTDFFVPFKTTIRGAANGCATRAARAFWDTERPQGGLTRRERVYHELFRELVDGKVVLARLGARSGDLLMIDLWYYPIAQKASAKTPAPVSGREGGTEGSGPGSGGPSSTGPPGQPTDGSPGPPTGGPSAAEVPIVSNIAQVQIGDYGIHMSVSDSFLLVKRIHETTGSVPSNFKGAGGVSLLWNYALRRGEKTASLWNGLSWGANVSWLNFLSSKEIEVGLGTVLGLFGGQVQVGFGLDLNGSGGVRDRSYYFVGLSFAKIAEKLQGGSAGGSSAAAH